MCGSVFNIDKKFQKVVIFFSTKSYCGHVKMKLWLPRQKYSWQKAEVFFCQVPLSQKKSCKFFEKEFFKTVQWTSGLQFWHNRGKKCWKANVFCPMSQNDIKENFFPKILFFSEKPCCARIEWIFDKPASFLGNANRFSSITDAEKTERNRSEVSHKKCSFQQKVLVQEDCSFDEPNDTFSPKKPSVLTRGPK